jgi:oligoribonuclease (3'-5' exoribonuclease)
MTLYEGPLLWCDLETTGIEPREHGASILEVGMVLTVGNELSPVAEASLLIRPPGTMQDHDALWGRLPQVVRDMHERTGLWKEATLGQNAWAVHDADRGLADWLDQQLRGLEHFDELGNLKPVSLCGSGVERFDRPWIIAHMPLVAQRLTYYSVWDLGTHRRALQYVGREDLTDTVKDVDNKPHRALADARLHAEEARRYTRMYQNINLPEAMPPLPDDLPGPSEVDVSAVSDGTVVMEA